MFKVTKAYETIIKEGTREEQIETSEIVYQDVKMSLRSILKEIKSNCYVADCHCLPRIKNSKDKKPHYLYTANPEKDFELGWETRYYLFISCQERHFYKICRLAKVC